VFLTRKVFGVQDFTIDKPAAATGARRPPVVMTREEVRAVINHLVIGFKAVQPTRAEVAALQGRILNFGSPQSRHADAIWELFASVLLPNPDDMDRVKRHYRIFRATAEQPGKLRLRCRRSGG
jgi:Asp/Glu/hydantoin racemase